MKLYIATFALIGALAGCSETHSPKPLATELGDSSEINEEHEVASAVKIHGEDYVKPGASIRFSNDYDGHTDPGVREAFTIDIVPAYDEGQLIVVLTTSEGLDLLVASEFTMDISGGTLSLPIELRAENSGTYHLGVNARVSDAGSIDGAMRAYGVRIQAGEAQEVSQKQQAPVLDANGEAIISTAAEEMIR